jgi:DNA end-binding protein Ku
MRPLWKGSIGFGLVNIPIGLYSATEDSNLTFFTMDKKNKAAIRYKKVNDATGAEVKQGDIVKAYKVGNSTVIMEEEDFNKAMPGKTEHIEIIQFVAEKEIDTLYYEKPYYIAPLKGGEKAYALLREALKKEGKAALGTFVFHKREWVCLLKPSADALVLHQLRFAEEIRSTKGLELPEIKPKNEELKIAASLIAQLTKPFKPEQFKDEYAQKLLKIIEAKAKGKTTKFKPMKVVHTTETEDLMAKLKASLKPPTKKAS